MTPALAEAPYSIRADLLDAVGPAWSRIGAPGTWWTGAERVAIAAETRHAASCSYCARIREALSPFSEFGEHDALGDALPDPAVDLIHRLVNDSGRLTPSWFQETIDGGLDEPAYVEAVAVAVVTIAVDTLYRGLGLPLPELPAARPGEPTRVEPPVTQRKFSWVRTVPPKDATETLRAAWWPSGEESYVPRIHQMLSLVPDEVLAFVHFAHTLYLPANAIIDFTSGGRAISRAQMELLASRVSALNECFY